MKQKDIALIIVVAVMSGILAVFMTSLIFKPASRQQKAEVVEPISDAFQEPDKKYFNSESIDPTQIIRIGDGSNPVPLTDSTQ